MMEEGKVLPGALADRRLERSWERCLESGKEPQQEVSFDIIAPEALRRTLEANRLLVRAARPVLEKLGRAIAGTRYFALLTDEHGVVVDVNGAYDRRDRRADLITRIGTDLSELHIGTSAISVALSEQVPVWLHQSEHFFDANSVYSCAGAPLFGPDGNCVGMLDLTGIEATERPELKHLASQSARSIENALMLSRLDSRSGLLIRLNWPGSRLEADTDGLICLDTDGLVTGANQTARQMVPQLGRPAGTPLHCSDLFAMAFEMLFDAAQLPDSGWASAMEVPLWSGLRLQALPVLPGQGDILAAMPVQA